MQKEEKIAYLKALIYIATIDEKFDDNEKQYLLDISNAYGLDRKQSNDLIKSVLDRKENLENILSKIKNRKTKLLLIYELIALCYVDGNYSSIEKNGIHNIANILQIEYDKVNNIENLLDDNLKLQEKINMVLER